MIDSPISITVAAILVALAMIVWILYKDPEIIRARTERKHAGTRRKLAPCWQRKAEDASERHAIFTEEVAAEMKEPSVDPSRAHVDAAPDRLGVPERLEFFFCQPRLGRAGRRDELDREDYLRGVDPVFGHVRVNQFDGRAVELDPARLPVLGVLAHEERLALGMVLTGHLHNRAGYFEDAGVEVEVHWLQPDGLAEPQAAGD